MSTLLIVRHGQASFGKADYDKLTPVGVAQAARLGQYFAAARKTFDLVFMGPRLRQRDTARHMLAAMPPGLPAPKLVEGLDEYDAEAIMRAAVPTLPDEVRRFLDAPHDARRFQEIFETVMHRWIGGELPVETFADFARRARAAFLAIMAETGRGKTACVVTSAGPMAVAVQMALEHSDLGALKQSWIVANTGVTEIKFRGDEMALITFNALPHLREQRLITYR